MKRYIINFIIIGIIITLLSSCKDKPQNVSCQIIVYDEASTTKAYLISYNGKDSIETICGRLSFDIIRRLHYNQKINMKEVRFRTIYLKDAHKINPTQQDTLQTTIVQLLSHPTKDTIPILARDAIINKITNVYDEKGNLKEQTCSDSDGILLWKSAVTYKNGKKSDVSDFGKDGSLKTKTIYLYENSKLSDETVYNSDGALINKTTYKYDDKGRISVQDIYFSDGSLAQESQISYTEKGAKDTVSYYDLHGKLTSKCVFRYAANGTLSEATTYGADNQTTTRQLVKYDANGNIARITTYNVAKKFGTTFSGEQSVSPIWISVIPDTATIAPIPASFTSTLFKPSNSYNLLTFTFFCLSGS